jgi:excisionase family DNA binding protein
MEQILYSVSELSTLLKLHPKTIIRFIHENKILGKKIGRAWMVTIEALKEYTHKELQQKESIAEIEPAEAVKSRITVSAVIEIRDQNSEDASRISNSLMAMLNCKDDSFGTTRFDFLYYPEIHLAKYIVYGSPRFIAVIMDAFDVVCRQKD